MSNTNDTPGHSAITTACATNGDSTAIDATRVTTRRVLTAVAAAAIIPVGFMLHTARADTPPALNATVECANRTIAITATGQGQGVRYTALDGPLAQHTFRVVNTPTAPNTWAFATDIAELNPTNAYDVRYRIDLTSETQGNGAVIATKTVLTPATCDAKAVTITAR